MGAAGSCDFIDISGGTAARTDVRDDGAVPPAPAGRTNAGAIRSHLATVIRAHPPTVSAAATVAQPPVCSVMTVGGIREPAQAEDLLSSGEADLVALGEG